MSEVHSRDVTLLAAGRLFIEKAVVFALAASFVPVAMFSSRAEEVPQAELISSQELAVLKGVVAGICNSPCVTDGATMAGYEIDAEQLLMAGITGSRKELIEDFNARNAKPRRLPSGLSDAARPGLLSPAGERRRCLLSRPGFDKECKHALVLAKLVYVYTEDIMNEGMFLILANRNGTWALEGTYQAWQMTLGD